MKKERTRLIWGIIPSVIAAVIAFAINNAYILPAIDKKNSSVEAVKNGGQEVKSKEQLAREEISKLLENYSKYYLLAHISDEVGELANYCTSSHYGVLITNVDYRKRTASPYNYMKFSLLDNKVELVDESTAKAMVKTETRVSGEADITDTIAKFVFVKDKEDGRYLVSMGNESEFTEDDEHEVAEGNEVNNSR